MLLLSCIYHHHGASDCFEISQVPEAKLTNQQLWPLYPESLVNAESILIESDLYSISTEVCTDNSHISDIPQIAGALRSASQSSQKRLSRVSSRSSRSMADAVQYVEPLYKSFFCPLTNQIMDDPVTIQSGATYERTAIIEYFENLGEKGEIICPTMGKKLESMALSPNIALRNIIQEWKDRNDTARLKVIRAALSIGSTDSMILEALQDLQNICQKGPQKIKEVRDIGIIPLLVRLLELKDRMVRCAALEMTRFLGEIILEDNSKTYVAEKTSSALIQMLQSGNPLTRKAVFKALLQISSHHANARILVESGIAQIMVEEMFAKKIYSEPADSLKEASAILANILESGLGLQNLMINNQGHTMASGYVVFNIIHMIKNSTPDDLNLNLIRILSCLTMSGKSTAPVVSAVKESEASYALVELLNNPSDDIAIAAIKLLTLLSPHIGHLLIDRLCKTNGQPEGLIQSPLDPSQITERQALSISFLAKLPHQNLTLNLALLGKNIIPIQLYIR